MPVRKLETPVLIVGGGPTGLSASVCLSRLGVPHVLVERHPSTAVHPQAHVINTRTMELFRMWGIAGAVLADSLPVDQSGLRIVESMVGRELANLGREGRMLDDAGRADLEAKLEARRRRHGNVSPTRLTSCAQDSVERHLRATAASAPTADLRFATTCTDVDPGDDAALAKLESSSGESTTVRADWVIAADGSRSLIRRGLGIEMQGEGHLGDLINVYFYADLTEAIRDRPALLYFVRGNEVSGTAINMDGRGRWVFNFAWDPDRENLADYTPTRCAAIVRAAIGTDVDVEVRSVLPWRMTAHVAERYRAGRVFLAGDAAHAFPPTGGFGLNSGVQDAHNLAWKIAAVHHGWAGSALLDSYEPERLPVGRFNCEQSARNARGEGGRGHFFHLGQDLGFRYDRSPAVIADDTTPPPLNVEEYVPSASPGSRFPHVWLDETGSVSTLDLLGDRFTLLAPGTPSGQRWVTATETIAHNQLVGVPLAAVTIGEKGDHPDPSGDWARLTDIGAAGAVLIRPDGHVVWRTRSLPDDPEAVLCDVLRAVLARSEHAHSTL